MVAIECASSIAKEQCWSEKAMVFVRLMLEVALHVATDCHVSLKTYENHVRRFARFQHFDDARPLHKTAGARKSRLS